MQKIFNADILDLIVTDNGFIYSCEETNEDGNKIALFYEYSEDNDVFTKIPVVEYITAKYGKHGRRIAKSLGDFITCRVINLENDVCLASYRNGLNRYFDSYGAAEDSFKIEYLGNPACSPAPGGKNLWYAVPDSNTVICYSLKYERIEVRMGSPDEKAFFHPTDIKMYDNMLYVCNKNSYKIKTIDIKTFDVQDYCIFSEPVSGYFRTDIGEYVILNSGVYSLKDE
ncbi:MAG: hypothetical protein K6B52_09050 [Clostridiales bacterium]|nr:hypothetical protein [Clostridiales bacterium]